MSDQSGDKDYEIGYGKPPKSGQFKKGVSGNPSGRPKKQSDFVSELMRELNSKVSINEGGERKVITKYSAVVKQLVNKAASGSMQAQRFVLSTCKQAEDKQAEYRESYTTEIDIESLDLLTDKELLMVASGIPVPIKRR